MDNVEKSLDSATFLIIDDDPMLRLMLRETLASGGYNVVEAETGEQGLECYYEINPNLVMLDVMLPGMDGFSVCQKIRESNTGKHKPIVMLTGLDDIDSINHAYESGATDFVTKPINWGILLQRLRYLLRVNELFVKLAKNERLLNNAQRIARLGNWEWGLNQDLFKLSQQAKHILNLTAAAKIGLEEFVAVIHPEDKDEFIDKMHRARSGIEFSLESRLDATRFGERFVSQQAEVYKNDSGMVTHVLGTVQDISKQKKAEEKIRYLAYYDSLTGLANRNLFKEQVRSALAGAKRRNTHCAIMYLDLDNFKKVNDTFGHDAGDELVKQFAQRLKYCVRQTDCASRKSLDYDICSMSRMGGDEFTVLLTDLKETEQASIVANRVLEALREPFHITGDTTLQVTTSIGISFFPHDGDNLDTLIKHADTAMYYAKSKGKNNCVFYENVVD